MNLCLPTLQQLQASLQGDDDKAIATLRELTTADTVDADVHVAVAQWASELEQPDIVLREWSLAHRDRPDDLEILTSLAEAYLDAGRLDKAARCLKLMTCSDPTNAQIWESLLAVLQQLGMLEEAEESRRRAFALTSDIRFKTQQAGTQEILGDGTDDDLDDPADEAFLTIFQEAFRGREGVYARQWVDPKGQTGYTPIHEPLSLRAIKNHLLGNHTLGIYPLRMDNTVFFAAIDLDLAPAVTRACAPESEGWTEAFASLENYTTRLCARAEYLGLKLHPADSGQKGRHLWALFSEPVPAKQARQMCKAITAGISVPPVVRYEIFPKQSTIPTDKLGNLIKVPLGIHRKTGRRVWFLDAKPEWRDQKTYLQLATRIARDQLSQCQDVIADQELSLFAAPATKLAKTLPSEGLRKSPSSLIETKDNATSPTMAVEPELYHLESDAELQLLLSRCVTLRALVAKVDMTGQLSHDEIRVLTHTVGHLATGPAAVNAILNRCLQTDTSLYLKRPLRGNPMSCASIRARIPDVTANLPCDCHFPRRGGLYPTPTLHLTQATGTFPIEELQFQALLTDFLRAKKEVARLTLLLDGFTEKLTLWFEESGADEMRTNYGVLRRKVDEAGVISFELTV